MVSSGDVDRLFLQAIISRGIISSDLAQVLWRKCIKAVNDSNEALNIRDPQDTNAWGEYITKINKSLDKLDLEFSSLRDELTGREMYALVNRKDDEIAQLATDYTPAEIIYFRAIVEQIMLAPHEAYVISSFAALRAPNELGLTTISKSQAEVILASFVAKGWLLKSKSGYYSLSTRSRLELLPYLKSNYPDDILECSACTQIMTRGFACPTEDCKGRFHTHCLENYRRRANKNNKPKCPKCQSEWPDQLDPVGENAYRTDGRRRSHDDGSEDDPEDNEIEQPSQDSPAPKKNGRRIVKKEKKKEASVDTSEEEDEDEDMEATQTQATQKHRRSARR